MDYILLIPIGIFFIVGLFSALCSIKNDTDKINKKLDEYIKSQKDNK